MNNLWNESQWSDGQTTQIGRSLVPMLTVVWLKCRLLAIDVTVAAQHCILNVRSNSLRAVYPWWFQYAMAWLRHQMETLFRVTDHLCGEFTGHRWIPRKRPVTRSFDVFFDLRPNSWVNNREAGDLRRHRGHHDVSVMNQSVAISVVYIIIPSPTLKKSTEQVVWCLWWVQIALGLWIRWGLRLHWSICNK